MSAHQTKPIPVAITMGDPNAIGLETIISAWQQRQANGLSPFLLYAHRDAIGAIAPDMAVEFIGGPNEAIDVFDRALPVMEIAGDFTPSPGVSQPSNSPIIIAAIESATRAAMQGEVSAVVTAPIHKASMAQGGFHHSGHTGFLAELCGLPSDKAVMMLANEHLRAVPVTIHLGLKDAIASLKAETIIHAACTTHGALRRDFGIEHPRLAIAGLNPHAGEEGLMGLEDGLIIKPAIDMLQDFGIDATGPYPADTLFHAEARAKYDAALCMYHDQALIPVKTLDFHGGVNVTLGLPIIRTSPDHGTAFDIVGTGTARPDSMIAAIRMAANCADKRQSS